MLAARLRLASVPVVIVRWSTDLDVFFIISGVPCIVMIEDEQIESFPVKKVPRETIVFGGNTISRASYFKVPNW